MTARGIAERRRAWLRVATTWLESIEGVGSGATTCDAATDELYARSLRLALLLDSAVDAAALPWLRAHTDSEWPREREIAEALLDHFEARIPE